MATVGTMVVNMVARTEAFIKGMDASKRRIRMLERATARTMMVVRRFGMILTGVAIGGMTLLVRKSMQNIDTIAKLSDRIGVTTEFLSAFGHAAKLAGTSSEQFNKSMEMFVRRMGEAAQGTGEALRGMEQLGLTANDLLSISTEDAFLRVAEGIRGLGTQAEKAAAAYQFFGRSGSQMLNLLQGDLSNVQSEAERLGITFDRSMAARIERANDAVSRMKASFMGVANSIAIAVSPMIEVIAEQVADLASGEHSLERIESAVRNMAFGLSYVHDAFLAIKGVVEGIAGAWLYAVGITMQIPEKLTRLLGLTDINEWISAIGESFFQEGEGLFGNNAIRQIGNTRKELEKFFNEVDRRKSDWKTPELGLMPEDDTSIIEPGKSFGDASAMEISRHVDVRGLSMGGMTDKQDTTNNLLQDQNRILRELESKLVMN